VWMYSDLVFALCMLVPTSQLSRTEFLGGIPFTHTPTCVDTHTPMCLTLLCDCFLVTLELLAKYISLWVTMALASVCSPSPNLPSMTPTHLPGLHAVAHCAFFSSWFLPISSFFRWYLAVIVWILVLMHRHTSITSAYLLII
jgi:hypothetical protein